MKKIRVLVTVAVLIFGGFMITRSIWNKVERDEQADRIAAVRGCGKNEKNMRLTNTAAHNADGTDVEFATGLFLKCGFDVREDGNLLLRMAVKFNVKESVGILLKAGANVHAERDEALLIAVNQENIEMVETLLAAGACPGARDNEPLLLAIRWGNKPLIERLLKAGAKVDQYAVNFANRLGKDDIVKILLQSVYR